MTYEEAITKLDDGIKNNFFHSSVRDEYARICKTPEGLKFFEGMLSCASKIDQKKQERKARKEARKAASQCKGEEL